LTSPANRKIKLPVLKKPKAGKPVSKKNQFIQQFLCNFDMNSNAEEEVDEEEEENLSDNENDMYDIFTQQTMSKNTILSTNYDGKGFVKNFLAILDNDFFCEFVNNITNIQVLYKILPDKRQQIEVLVCRLMGQIPNGFEIYNNKESSIGLDEFINTNRQFPNDCLTIIKVAMPNGSVNNSRRKKSTIGANIIFIQLEFPKISKSMAENGKIQPWLEMYTILMLFGFVKFIVEHKVTNKLYPMFILNLKDVYGLKKYFKSKQQCQWVENVCYYVYMLKNVFNCCISL